MNHVHNADPTKGAVCSHLVTDAMNCAWGLTTRRTDKVVGTPVVTREGISGDEAFRIAWNRGLVVVCSIPPVRTPFKGMSEAARVEAIAWVEANVRPRDRRERVA